MNEKKYKLVLIDRDGVINKKAEEHDYIRTVAMLELLPGVEDAIGRLNRAGFKVAVVSNQRGVSRGLMTLGDVWEINESISNKLAGYSAQIDSFHICPHGYDDKCSCRKPEAGLLLEAMNKYKVNRNECIMIGDSVSDIGAAINAGVDCIYIGKSEGVDSNPDVLIAADLSNAVDIILKDLTINI